MATQDAQTLESEAVASSVDAGQSQKPEATQEVQSASPVQTTPALPALDMDAIKKEVLAQLRTEAEADRRKVQSQADRKIQEIQRNQQAVIEAERKAILDALKTQGVDDEVLARVQQEAPTRAKAAQYDMLIQEREIESQTVMLDQLALEKAQRLGLKREDFAENEWGGGLPLELRPIDVWYERVAVPKAMARTHETAVATKVAEVVAKRAEAMARAAAGVTATDVGGNGMARNRLAELEKLNKQGPPDDPRGIQEYIKKLNALSVAIDSEDSG